VYPEVEILTLITASYPNPIQTATTGTAADVKAFNSKLMAFFLCSNKHLLLYNKGSSLQHLFQSTTFPLSSLSGRNNELLLSYIIGSFARFLITFIYIPPHLSKSKTKRNLQIRPRTLRKPRTRTGTSKPSSQTWDRGKSAKPSSRHRRRSIIPGLKPTGKIGRKR
jgi:hypothetical protein